MANYYKRKNGTYCVRVSNGMKDGKQELLSATYRPKKGMTPAQEKKGVEEFAALFEAAVHSGSYIPGMKSDTIMSNAFGMTVGTFIREHYLKRIEKKLSPNTVRFYTSIAEQFIIPSFGDIRLSDITVKHQQAFVDYLTTPEARANAGDTAPLAAATVKRYATVFSSVITEACRMGIIEENKLRGGCVEFPKIMNKPLDVYNDDEAKRFVEALEQEPPKTRLMLLCALLLGMRRAEIVALKWSDINLRGGSLSVNKSAYKSKGKPQMLKSPKSRCGNRTLYFSDVLTDAFECWRVTQAEEKASAGTAWREQDFVFTNEIGDMVSLYTLSRLCSRFEEKCGLHHLKLHGLRHTCGSLMAANGVDAETVKSVLGHESIETTNLYLHPYEKNMRKAAGILEDIISR